MLKYGLAAALLAGSAATGLARVYQGAYSLNLVSYQLTEANAQACLVLVATGGIANFPNSGTFTGPAGQGIAGQYIVSGNAVHLIKVSGGLGDNIDMIGTSKGRSVAGAYDDVFAGGTDSGATDVSSGTFTLTPGRGGAAPRTPLWRHATTG